MLFLYIVLTCAVIVVNIVKILVYRRDKLFFVLDDSRWKWLILFFTIIVFWFVFVSEEYKYLLYWLAVIEIGDFALYMLKND